MKVLSLLLFAVIILFASCNRTVSCTNQYITPAFIGFSIADIDTLIIREFKKGNNFLQPIDTVLITNDPHSASYSTSNDTTIVILNVTPGQSKYILPDHDWQIFIPAKNKTIAISNIISPQTEYSCFKCVCTNPINSFIQNGQTIIPQTKRIPNFGSDGYFTYIYR
jgi:hypothetical protein